MSVPVVFDRALVRRRLARALGRRLCRFSPRPRRRPTSRSGCETSCGPFPLRSTSARRRAPPLWPLARGGPRPLLRLAPLPEPGAVARRRGAPALRARAVRPCGVAFVAAGGQRPARRAGPDPPRAEARRAFPRLPPRRRDPDASCAKPSRRPRPRSRAARARASRPSPTCATSAACCSAPASPCRSPMPRPCACAMPTRSALMRDLRAMGLANAARRAPAAAAAPRNAPAGGRALRRALRRPGRARAGHLRDGLALGLGAAREPAEAAPAGLGEDAPRRCPRRGRARHGREAARLRRPCGLRGRCSALP